MDVFKFLKILTICYNINKKKDQILNRPKLTSEKKKKDICQNLSFQIRIQLKLGPLSPLQRIKGKLSPLPFIYVFKLGKLQK